MPITPTNAFKGRQYRGEVILSYEHVAEMVGERGIEVDTSCIWRWVQAYAPELDKVCRPHLNRPTRATARR